MKTNSSCCLNWTKNVFKSSRSSVNSFLMLLFFMLCFVSGASAQQPSCNLRGNLEARFSRSGGDQVTVISEVVKAAPGAVYNWSFKTNDTNASIVSGNGTPNLIVKSGKRKGGYTVQLTVTNPSTPTLTGKSCTCTKSVSVQNAP